MKYRWLAQAFPQLHLGKGKGVLLSPWAKSRRRWELRRWKEEVAKSFWVTFFLFFFLFFGGSQGLTLARQALYDLSHSASPWLLNNCLRL
jgi:hypothetical protein